MCMRVCTCVPVCGRVHTCVHACVCVCVCVCVWWSQAPFVTGGSPRKESLCPSALPWADTPHLLPERGPLLRAPLFPLCSGGAVGGSESLSDLLEPRRTGRMSSPSFQGPGLLKPLLIWPPQRPWPSRIPHTWGTVSCTPRYLHTLRPCSAGTAGRGSQCPAWRKDT